MLKMVSLNDIIFLIRRSRSDIINLDNNVVSSEKEKLEKLSLAIKDEEFESTKVTVIGNWDRSHQFVELVSAFFDKVNRLRIQRCNIDDNIFRAVIPKLPVLYSIHLFGDQLSQISLYRVLSHLTPKSNLKEISFYESHFVSKNFDEIDADKINYDVILKRIDINHCGDYWDCYKQIAPIAVRISQELSIDRDFHSEVKKVIKEFKKRGIKYNCSEVTKPQ